MRDADHPEQHQPFLHQPLPQQPLEDGEPVFQNPWEAKTFAMAVHLHERGVFSWPEWSQALSQALSNTSAISADGKEGADKGKKNDADAYYQVWQEALEDLLIRKHLHR